MDVSKVGFNAAEAQSQGVAEVVPDDLMKFGLIPELIGRLAIIVQLQELSLDALMRVLTKPKGALVKQYKELFALEGVELKFTEAALYEIARRAQGRGTGARGLRSIMEKTLLELMYEVPGSDVVRLVIDEGQLDHPHTVLMQAERRKTA